MSSGKILEIEIHSFAFGGAGVGKLPDGKVCFVRGAAPGELVKIEITEDKNSYAYGRLISVKRSSPDRVVPFCPLAINKNDNGHRCPGCSYAHVKYETEVRWKQKQLEGFLLRERLVEKDRIRPPVSAPARSGWRNKIRLSAGTVNGKKVLGYKGDDNTTVINVPECPLARRSINETLAKYVAEPQPEKATHVTFRWTLHNGVIVRPNTMKPGERFLTEQLGHLGDFDVPENSFFQINVPMAAKLADAAAERIASGGTKCLVELFCGVGILSIAAAEKTGGLRVRAVELDKTAIQAARVNAKKHGLTERCRYFAGDAEKSFADLICGMPCEDTMLLLDPPRCGISASLCRKITAYSPKFILYISCAPDTLTRDLKLLTADGYEVCDVQLFDLFPSTAHFETMTVLRRRN